MNDAVVQQLLVVMLQAEADPFREDERQHRQAVLFPRHVAFEIAGHAGPAHFGTVSIDRA